ncbi:uncharacterized protein [Scyliorhinus torazame]|uniref:uncharacterized protein isoform X6 n=1 Tax=Scyliorhinus torazame TaxID=75743 RepID=UPI003B59BDB6
MQSGQIYRMRGWTLQNCACMVVTGWMGLWIREKANEIHVSNPDFPHCDFHFIFKRKQRNGDSQVEDDVINDPFQPVYNETLALTQSVPEPKGLMIEEETSNVFIPGLTTKRKHMKKNKIAVSLKESPQKELFERVQNHSTPDVTPDKGCRKKKNKKFFRF